MLLPFLTRLANNWYEIGAMLLEEKQEEHLKLIQTTHGSDAKKCCLAMLQYWMDTQSKATWNHLVTALRSPGVEMDTVASDIERNFTGKMEHCDTLYMILKFILHVYMHILVNISRTIYMYSCSY